MKKFLQILLHPIALALYGLLALSALVWWVSPLIAFGENHPFDGMWTRLGVIALMVLVWLLIVGLRALRRKRANAELLQGLSGGGNKAGREAEQLDERFKEALTVLEDSAKQSGKRGFFKRGQYLYDLPWYIFIGAPGSGKTTALLNAGLTFPLAGKMGQAPVKGVGGTRNCDWWFTDEAVLIDTAGRYTLQQSDEKADASAWEKFLDLLKKSRPRRPINGVLLTLNVQDLLQQSPADRKEHAQRLRARLQELHERLGVRPPVYVLVTKSDLIAGFNETFGDFGKEERDQVWGFSFPYDPRGEDTPVQEFASEFAALEKRLRDRVLDRMESQQDPLKRAAIFSFPQQFAGLKGLMGGFLESVFDGGGQLEQRALLRGVYFTSGTQEGTPIDRVLGTLARTFGVDQKAASIASTRGKSFFLTRLLSEVVFTEQGLVGENRRAESSRKRRRVLGLATIAVLSLVLIAGWAMSWMRNKAYVDEVQARLSEVKSAVEALPPAGSTDVSALPQVLDKVAAAPKPTGYDIDHPPLLNTLGLYQGDYLQAGADIGYRHLLDRALLPRVAKRLEERLRAVDRNNLELAYEALKGYLMLYTPEHFDAEALKAWVTLDWDANLAGTLTPEQRAALATHLDAALAEGAPRALAPMDKTLVANVREMLVAYPLEYRVFSRLKRAQVGADFPEFSVASAGGPNAAQVFERASGQPITKGIPGLFTRDGYFKAFKGAVAKVANQLQDEQNWVLGVNAPAASLKAQAGTALGSIAASNGGEMGERVRRLYLQEYIKVWDDYLADVRLVRLGGLDRSLAVARVLAAPDSPLPAYLRAVARETQLADQAQKEAAAGSGLAKIDEKANKAKADMAALVGNKTDPNAKVAGAPLEALVDTHFAYLHRMVAGTPAPIDDVTKLFNEVFVQLNAVDAAQKSKSAPPPAAAGGGAAAKAAAALQPEPIKSMLMALGDAGASQSMNAERQGLSGDLKPVTDFCSRTIAGRYPFAQGSKSDVLPDDFGQFFGVGGMMDDFFARRLATIVDIGATPWVYKPLADGSKPPGGAALADFQRAAKIKEAFFRNGGKAPGFKVDLRVLEMPAGMSDITIDVDGQALKFAAGNTAAQTINWPSTRVASQIKLSAGGGATQMFEGPWALFRMLNAFEVQASPQPERFVVVLNLDGKKARMEVISSSAINPLRMREVAAFRCPDGL
ncbi:type VI secretion system membrane subunit TssM [Xylophilus rhododendri]|uniref:Type VI secretion system membrane subunit TssM n=1 Tax=Xylophilus rhododendri TaxID=2697032 RepID=A0A857JDW5_9BURK|nr:type VI secretion system membrane subunit TssM [Xylophilus rhododendri]QHJ00969.1 type VI secretion system membrane subunit TssM [Xylophilus rhododendri]